MVHVVSREKMGAAAATMSTVVGATFRHIKRLTMYTYLDYLKMKFLFFKPSYGIKAPTIAIIALFLIMTILISGCLRQGIRIYHYDSQKQQEFEALFSSGMSQEEVEKILAGMANYEREKIFVTEKGNIQITYSTRSDRWGAPKYFFLFAPDGGLLSVKPPQPL